MISLDRQGAQHLSRRLFSGVSRLQENLDVFIELADLLNDCLTTHARHKVIDDNEMHFLVTKAAKRLLSTQRSEHPVPFPLEEELRREESFLLIINDKNRIARGTRCRAFACHALPFPQSRFSYVFS